MGQALPCLSEYIPNIKRVGDFEEILYLETNQTFNECGYNNNGKKRIGIA